MRRRRARRIPVRSMSSASSIDQCFMFPSTTRGDPDNTIYRDEVRVKIYREWGLPGNEERASVCTDARSLMEAASVPAEVRCEDRLGPASHVQDVPSD